MLRNCNKCDNPLLEDATVCNNCFNIDPYGKIEPLRKERRVFYTALFTIGLLLLFLFYCVDKLELLNYIRE